ncbi:MAG: CocE/NonD family hydrolase [Chloroflexi bacterium]|nr:CocE/NonD family hydrolase [Chloroflexota bacterium]
MAQAIPEPQFKVHVRRNVRIPMPDGITLAADVFMPEADGQFPVVMEYLPYRKNDVGWQGNYGQRYLAERGFVAVRLDVRGTGDSEGTAEDEYCLQEQLDGVTAIGWLAEQPWSNGKVGMFGSSYGGFNSLQVAMHRPPALKAIVPMYFTDRRYTDDCHYKGGAMQMLYDVGTYGLSMVGRNLLPPRPDLVGEQWAGIWEEHLQNEPWLLRWLAHQTEDEQWRLGSLCEDYGSIQCATYLIGGWRDGYVNCNLRAYQHLNCPKKVLIGPWLHQRPTDGIPGPRINQWRETARFFAYWLQDKDTGIMDEPPIAIYVQEYDPPRMDRRETSGFWRYETEWPLARGKEVTLYLGDGTLQPDSPPETGGSDRVAYHPAVGATFGIFSAGGPHLVPGDQRIEEAYSVVYTTTVLQEPVEILGHPQVILQVDSSADVVTFVVRLTDVAPDGSSALVTKGVLNATHRDSHTHPTPLLPGEKVALEIECDATSWIFAPGHRIRLSISHADFPNIWPSPKLATSHVYWGAGHPSRMTLPVVGKQSQTLPAPVFEATPFPIDPNQPPPVPPWKIMRDLARGQVEITIEGSGSTRQDGVYVHETKTQATATVSERNPAEAAVKGRQTIRYIWPSQKIEVNTRGHIFSDPTAFHITIHAEITIDDLPHFSRRWAKSFPRRLL